MRIVREAVSFLHFSVHEVVMITIILAFLSALVSGPQKTGRMHKLLVRNSVVCLATFGLLVSIFLAIGPRVECLAGKG